MFPNQNFMLSDVRRKKPELYNEKDVLGEHLFSKVSEIGLDFHHSQQITGMLLECEKDEVFRMLKDESFLESRVEKATDALLKYGNSRGLTGRNDTDVFTVHDPKISNELFENVYSLEPELSSQISGMLLEMSSLDVQKLLDSPNELIEAVARAKEAIIVDSCTHLTDDKEDIGDRVYETVEKLYPDHAAKITGMILEMSKEQLEEVLSKDSLLTDKIHQAYCVLDH